MSRCNWPEGYIPYIDPRALSSRRTPTNDFYDAAAAVINTGSMVASNVFSWKEARKMPELQADANNKVLERQKKYADSISKDQRSILQGAIRDYLKSIKALLRDRTFEKAFPDVPVAAEFVPVDACCMQASTIECNIEKVARADAYVSYVNRLHEQNDLIHALALDPRFLITLDIQSKSVNDLARGILPVGDVIEVLSDNAEQASLTGRIGSSRKTTARDLGISKLRAQAEGRKEFREATTWANSAVSPLQRQGDIRSMMQTPQERITLALHQSQLIQQSLQNKNNTLAQKEPYLMAELQTRIQTYITELQAMSSKALLVNSHIPNFAATIAPKMDNISGLVGSIGQAVQNANTSHFFGGWPKSQDGYRGQSSSSDVGEGSRRASDRPPGFDNI